MNNRPSRSDIGCTVIMGIMALLLLVTGILLFIAWLPPLSVSIRTTEAMQAVFNFLLAVWVVGAILAGPVMLYDWIMRDKK